MGRLIDGDALYKAMQDAEELARRRVRDTESTLPYPNNLNPAYTRYLAQMDERTKAKKMVADAPTVDAVEVVRCKDCRHWSGRKYNVHINGFLPWCRFSALQREANDFCSYGERKEDGSHEQRGEKA
ncbi:MAG: hypothetical protein II008_15135 [Oscillospiraceae bacterium]|nr:hypothetical protein [Oscillospiraceae bacterium]